MGRYTQGEARKEETEQDKDITRHLILTLTFFLKSRLGLFDSYQQILGKVFSFAHD